MSRLTLLLLALAAAAHAQTPSDWPAAAERAKAEGKDVAVLLDGSDWSHRSKPFRDLLAAVDAVLAPGHVGVVVDNPEASDDATKALVERNKGFGFRPWNLPGLALADERGRVHAYIPAAEVADAKALGARLAAAKEARGRMKAALDEAAKAQGAARADALGRALAAIDLGLARGQFGDVVKEIARLDPQDSAGWRLRYEFDDLGFLEGTVLRLTRDGKAGEALAEIDRRLANTRITPDQRHRLLAARFAALRQSGRMPEALGTLETLAKEDPEGNFGKGARSLHAFHTQPVPLRGWSWEGWDMRPEPSPMEIDASDKVPSAGDYAVETKGWGLNIRSVALVAGDKVLAETNRQQGGAWRLKLAERPSGQIRLRLVANGQGWYDGRGTIELRRE